MKKRLSSLISLLCTILIFLGCTPIDDNVDNTQNTKEEEKMNFKFESLQDISLMPGGYFTDFDGIVAQKDTALIEGKLIAAFGTAPWQSDNYENSFNYVIKATADDGRSVIFSVYNVGAIHIGCDSQDDFATEAAHALIEYVKSFTPADYERTVYYLDFYLQLDISVKNGEVTINQSEISEEKAMELFNKWYNN